MDQRILSVISKQIAELFHLSSIPKLAADDPRKRGKRIEKKKVNYTSYIDLLISCRHLLLQQSCVVGKPRAGAYSYDQKNDNDIGKNGRQCGPLKNNRTENADTADKNSGQKKASRHQKQSAKADTAEHHNKGQHRQCRNRQYQNNAKRCLQLSRNDSPRVQVRRQQHIQRFFLTLQRNASSRNCRN